MSQWEAVNGKRIRKRSGLRKACVVYLYKYILKTNEFLPFGEDVIPIYTARPKRIGASSFRFVRRL